MVAGSHRKWKDAGISDTSSRTTAAVRGSNKEASHRSNYSLSYKVCASHGLTSRSPLTKLQRACIADIWRPDIVIGIPWTLGSSTQTRRRRHGGRRRRIRRRSPEEIPFFNPQGSSAATAWRNHNTSSRPEPFPTTFAESLNIYPRTPS